MRVAMVVKQMHSAMAALAQTDERAIRFVALRVPVAEVVDVEPAPLVGAITPPVAAWQR
jgi:hypothetical protein